jgi:hypothetical protein
MAAVRAFAGATTGSDQWSLSRGFKDYLSCCFVSTTSGSTADSKMQQLNVADKNANDETSHVTAADDVCKSDTGSATSADADSRQVDEADGKTRHRHRPDELSSLSCRSGAGNDVAGRDCVDTTSLLSSSSALAGFERRSADGASIRSVEDEGSKSRSVSGSRFALDGRESVNGSGSVRTVTDVAMTEMDDSVKTGAQRRGSTSQISIGQESTTTIARYNGKALYDDA